MELLSGIRKDTQDEKTKERLTKLIDGLDADFSAEIDEEPVRA